MTHNRIWAAISFLLSIVISIMVVAHSFFYLQEILEYHWIVIFMALATIELAYISLPYIAKRNEGFIKFRYLALIGALFAASVIPATLQTTKDFRNQLEVQAVTIPARPQKSSLIKTYQIQLDKLGIQIGANQLIIKDMIERNFVTKSAPLQWANTKLNREKFRLSKKQVGLEEKFQGAMVVYNDKMEKLGNAIQKNELNVWFDRIKLTWSLLVILILQLANAAFVHHGSQLLIRPDESHKRERPEMVEEKDDTIINNLDEGTILTVDSLLENFKVSGVGPHKAQLFLEKYNINTVEQLSKIVNDDTVFEWNKEYFSHDTALVLNRMVRVIKRRLQSEDQNYESV